MFLVLPVQFAGSVEHLVYVAVRKYAVVVVLVHVANLRSDREDFTAATRLGGMAFLAGLLIGHDIGERLRCAGRRDQLHLDILAADVQRSILLVGIPDVGRAGPLAAGLAHDDPGFNQTVKFTALCSPLRRG